jgi:hypothetical protein
MARFSTRLKKMKMEDTIMIIIVVLVVLTVLYWLFISMKHNVHESFNTDWTNDFDGYSPYYINDEKLVEKQLDKDLKTPDGSLKKKLSNYHGSLDQCGEVCTKKYGNLKNCIGFDSKLKIKNNKKEYQCTYYYNPDDRIYKKIKITDDALTQSAGLKDKDGAEYSATKFFIKKNNNGINESKIPKIKNVKDFYKMNNPPTRPPKPTTTPGLWDTSVKWPPYNSTQIGQDNTTGFLKECNATKTDNCAKEIVDYCNNSSDTAMYVTNPAGSPNIYRINCLKKNSGAWKLMCKVYGNKEKNIVLDNFNKDFKMSVPFLNKLSQCPSPT